MPHLPLAENQGRRATRSASSPNTRTPPTRTPPRAKINPIPTRHQPARPHPGGEPPPHPTQTRPEGLGAKGAYGSGGWGWRGVCVVCVAVWWPVGAVLMVFGGSVRSAGSCAFPFHTCDIPQVTVFLVVWGICGARIVGTMCGRSRRGRFGVRVRRGAGRHCRVAGSRTSSRL